MKRNLKMTFYSNELAHKNGNIHIDNYHFENKPYHIHLLILLNVVSTVLHCVCCLNYLLKNPNVIEISPNSNPQIHLIVNQID